MALVQWCCGFLFSSTPPHPKKNLPLTLPPSSQAPPTTHTSSTTTRALASLNAPARPSGNTPCSATAATRWCRPRTRSCPRAQRREGARPGDFRAGQRLHGHVLRHGHARPDQVNGYGQVGRVCPVHHLVFWEE